MRSRKAIEKDIDSFKGASFEEIQLELSLDNRDLLKKLVKQNDQA